MTPYDHQPADREADNTWHAERGQADRDDYCDDDWASKVQRAWPRYKAERDARRARDMGGAA